MSNNTRPKIAVVGSGIAGLAAAWLLQRRYAVDLFERESRFGGHSNTVTVRCADGTVPVDTGFIVYNERNYPQLSALFRLLDVRTQASDMSFAVSTGGGTLEYAGDNLTKLFAQRSNLLRMGHWRMLGQILRFNRRARADLAAGLPEDLTLGDYLDAGRFGTRMRGTYLLPMAAAIWSCPTARMTAFPAASFLRFFANHGLLDLADRPQWRTVTGGSREYVRRLLADFQGGLFREEPVVSVRRTDDGVEIITRSGRSANYDQVVLACHADQALNLLADPEPAEVEILREFGYQENIAILHSDRALMPRRRRVWSSWNYLGDKIGGAVSVSYWMNRLQDLAIQTPLIVSLNPLRDPDPRLVHRACRYMHPVFTREAVAAQVRLHEELQGLRRTWFCGSYLGYGFHEDALSSAVDVARALGASIPWRVPEPDRVQAAGIAALAQA